MLDKQRIKGQWLCSQWQKKGWLYFMFLPLSYVFLWIVSLRRMLYQWGAFKSYQFSIPIVVVGNILVGGTGKTPLVIYLAQLLAAKGYKPGIASRGYRAKAKSLPYLVQHNDDPNQVGDEPLLLMRQTQCPVVIDPNRVRGIAYLLSKHDCDIVICDDGLQHYALGRDIEIAMVDHTTNFSNNALLPAGPFREPLSRLNLIDFIVSKNVQGQSTDYKLELVPLELIHIQDSSKRLPLKALQDNVNVHIVLGIGNPESFLASLKAFFVHTPKVHIYADHHQFVQQNFDGMTDDFILMTEKDAIKCERLKLNNAWYVSTEIKVTNSFQSDFINVLKYVHKIKSVPSLLGQTLSS